MKGGTVWPHRSIGQSTLSSGKKKAWSFDEFENMYGSLHIQFKSIAFETFDGYVRFPSFRDPASCKRLRQNTKKKRKKNLLPAYLPLCLYKCPDTVCTNLFVYYLVELVQYTLFYPANIAPMQCSHVSEKEMF